MGSSVRSEALDQSCQTALATAGQHSEGCMSSIQPQCCARTRVLGNKRGTTGWKERERLGASAVCGDRGNVQGTRGDAACRYSITWCACCAMPCADIRHLGRLGMGEARAGQLSALCQVASCACYAVLGTGIAAMPSLLPPRDRLCGPDIDHAAPRRSLLASSLPSPSFSLPALTWPQLFLFSSASSSSITTSSSPSSALTPARSSLTFLAPISLGRTATR